MTSCKSNLVSIHPKIHSILDEKCAFAISFGYINIIFAYVITIIAYKTTHIY
jgi:hypothetical protein